MLGIPADARNASLVSQSIQQLTGGIGTKADKDRRAVSTQSNGANNRLSVAKTIIVKSSHV